MSKVLVVGDIMMDVVIDIDSDIQIGSDTPSEITTSIGGTGTNVASWIGASGANACIVGCVGNDGWYQLIQNHLRNLNVEMHLHPQADLPTGIVVAIAHPDGERSMFPDSRANTRLTIEMFGENIWNGVSHFYISGYSLINPATRKLAVELMQSARNRSITVCFDPASVAPLKTVPTSELQNWLDLADVIFPNEMEWEFLNENFPEISKHPKLEIVHKKGAGGADIFVSGTREFSMPAIATEVVDSIGAGDAFAGTYLAALSTGMSKAEALASAIKAGAISVATRGAQPPKSLVLK